MGLAQVLQSNQSLWRGAKDVMAKRLSGVYILSQYLFFIEWVLGEVYLTHNLAEYLKINDKSSGGIYEKSL